jgi:hypothetical protein
VHPRERREQNIGFGKQKSREKMESRTESRNLMRYDNGGTFLRGVYIVMVFRIVSR